MYCSPDYDVQQSTEVSTGDGISRALFMQVVLFLENLEMDGDSIKALFGLTGNPNIGLSDCCLFLPSGG